MSPPSNRLGDRALTNNSLASRVVLYEEEAEGWFPLDRTNTPQGRATIGSVTWSTEMLSPGSGKAAEPAVRADIDIPERKTSIAWTLRRDNESNGSISHDIEILFKLPADFAGGEIRSVPGFWMKERERAREIPLTGLAVKVTTTL